MSTVLTTPGVPRRRDRLFPRRRTSLAAAVGFVVVVLFQLSLLFGAPFGAAALGGAHPGALPAELRMVSAVSALIWLLATLIVLARGGWGSPPLPGGVSRWGTWFLVGYLALGMLMNLASSSPWERFGWAPFTALLFGLTLLLALSERPTRPVGASGVPR